MESTLAPRERVEADEVHQTAVRYTMLLKFITMPVWRPDAE